MLSKINQTSIYFLVSFLSHFKLQANLRQKKELTDTFLTKEESCGDRGLQSSVCIQALSATSWAG